MGLFCGWLVLGASFLPDHVQPLIFSQIRACGSESHNPCTFNVLNMYVYKLVFLKWLKYLNGLFV